MLKYNNVKCVAVDDWDSLVKETYGKPYSFQQQDGCKPQGTTHVFSVPHKSLAEAMDYKRDTIPEKVNGDVMGVSFKAWLERDPLQPLNNGRKRPNSWDIDLFWERNFYPAMEMIAQDLYEKGLIEAGEYQIDIDW